ncbi:beta-N-acetylhexosaminidase [Hahella sp. CR1]|uniref:beta-N-acetylhexosaminidase n=1 Tax=Hahella sp. CR1 TaxID=2992807 RepID=UPI0024430DD7|nr:beta-N-acetylhexosaminidase [Hahella sp. CR1]MDG9667903.1 beta-N-acetylhexosaminidase [Hahella sp. CR1]
MSKTAKLGPLIIDLKGLDVSAEEKELLSRPVVGGVIFFARNYTDPQQLDALVKQIRAIRPELLLCVDQEGGRVQRFREGRTLLPAPGKLRASYQEDPATAKAIATELGWLTAIELREFDLDFSFAPVLDVDYGKNKVIADRAFGDTPAMAAALARAFWRGMGEAGCAGVGKHFPGHGFVAEDTHVESARDLRSYEDLLDADMLPFIEMIDAGVEAMMPAHVIYPACDPSPASQSAFWLTQVLRERLQYQGAIISDDMGMQGADLDGEEGESASVVRALQAGCDLLMACNNPERLLKVANKLEALPEDLLFPEDSLRRRHSMRRRPLGTVDQARLARARELAQSLRQ